MITLDWNNPAIINGMRCILRPIVRLALRGGCNFRMLSRLLKAEFVIVGAEELERSGTEANASRIAALTGLNRNDIISLQQGLGRPSEPSVSISARVLAVWEQDKRFCNSRKQPRILTCVGKGCEFDELVQTVSAHLGFHTVLNELERLSLVERTPAGVRPVVSAAWATKDVVRGLEFLGRNIGIATAAVEENTDAGKPINTHMTTTYDNIYVSSVPKIREIIRTESIQFHSHLRKILSTYDADTATKRKSEAAGARVSLFSVSLVEDPPADSARQRATERKVKAR